MRLAFAECVFDSATRQLLREGREVHLTPKAFLLLETLLANRPRVLRRAELEERMWPDVYVSRTSLGRLLVELRGAIGDRARQGRLIRTVHGVGFAFCGNVAELGDAPAESTAGPAACLVLGSRVIPLHPGTNVLGRGPGSTAAIEAVGVSREHARLLIEAGRATIEDLGSKNGTFVNRRRIGAATPLADGDEIGIGVATMTLRLGGEGPTATLPS